MQVQILLSKLVPSKRNPRKVKPEREAHQRLVASIRAHGLLEPLIVRPLENGKCSVIAGNRRLAALREIHEKEDPKIACQVHKTDEQSAEAMAMAENFVREAMHPLDEAIAFDA